MWNSLGKDEHVEKGFGKLFKVNWFINTVFIIYRGTKDLYMSNQLTISTRFFWKPTIFVIFHILFMVKQTWEEW